MEEVEEFSERIWYAKLIDGPDEEPAGPDIQSDRELVEGSAEDVTKQCDCLEDDCGLHI